MGYKNANLSIRLDLWKIVELIRCLKTSLSPKRERRQR